MLDYISKLIAAHPFISIGLSVFIGAIIHQLGLDVYKLIKILGRHIGLFIKAVWRLILVGWRFILNEKRTMTASKDGSQDQWKKGEK